MCCGFTCSKVINEEREKGKKDDGRDEKREQLQPDSSPHMQLQISDGTKYVAFYYYFFS